MKKQLILFLATVLIIAFACQKELSFESPNTPSKGSLKDDATGDCLPQTVNGTYVAGTALVSATNTIVVQVDVTQTGSYVIYTDTVNGYYFRTTGVFTNLGLTNVTLRSNGTPFAAGTNNFVVNYDTSVCNIAVTVLPAGTGAAAFTLVSGGTPTNCASATVTGTYTQGVALVAANNYVDIMVNVTTVGTYTITATGGGMTFSKTGTFSATGNQAVRLDGAGTPTTVGANTITFAAPFASCSFTVTVVASGGPAAFTLVSGGTPTNCASAVVTGVYVQNTALVAANNYVDIQVNVTTIGTYTITATGGGMTFSKTGTFASTGTQSVRLDGSGTPTTSGNNTITFAAPFASCTFTVYVLANDYYPRTANSNWSYEWDDTPTDSVMRTATSNTISAAGNNFTIFMQNDGVTPQPDSAGYYRRNGTDYFEWFDFGSWIGYDNPLWVEYTMLKSAATENVAWKSPATGGWAGTAGGNNFNLRFSYKILTGQKDVPITFTTSTGAATYQNVIVVEERIEMEVTPGNWQDITSTIDYYGKSYYARGIGLVKFEALNASGVVQNKMELRRWQVN